MTGPVRLTLVMQPQRGCEAEFIAAWRLVAAATSRIPGSLRQTLVGTESTQLVITSDWSSIEEMRRWETSDEQHTLTAAIRALRQSVSARVEPILLHVDSA